MSKKPQKMSAAAEQPPVPTPEILADEAARAALFQVTQSTFADLGGRLPIGFLHQGDLHRSFGFRRFTSRQDREIEAVRKKNKRMSMGALVTHVLSVMLTNLGPHDFEALDEAQRRLVVNQMWIPDVMYAYITLRIEALGPDVAFDVECSACAYRWKFTADLSRTDVKCAESVGGLVKPYALRDGVEHPTRTDADPIFEVLLQPPRWQAMAALTRDGDMGDVKTHLMASSIRQIGDGTIPVLPQVLDTLTKYDLEHLQKAIDDLTPGPELTLECDCPDCGHRNERNLNWAWDFFFTASSL